MQNKTRYQLLKFITIIATLLLTTCGAIRICHATNIKIVQKPIIFDKERKELTQEYRFEHYGIKSKSIEIKPRMIVLHWTCTENFQDAYKIFNRSTLSDRPDIKKRGQLKRIGTFFG